jgi:glycosyltransferase involved in cell wall biosynthesis
VPLTIAYLTGQYGRPSDTWIRGEVWALRDMGHTVHTFSIRRPDGPPVTGVVEEERARTDYILENGGRALLGALARWALRRPARFASALRLALEIGWPGLKGRLWPFAYLAEAAYLADRIEALGIDHLHNHISEGSASVAMLASELTGRPFSVVVHGPGEFDLAHQLALDRKVERSAFFVAGSTYAGSQLMRWCHADHWDRIHRVRTGVPHEALQQPIDPPPDAPRLATVGRMDEVKGHLFLVEALALLEGRGVRVELEIVGDGPMRARIEELALRLGVSDRIRIHGYLDRPDAMAVVAGARAIVMPSLAEGLPVAIADAMAMGRPAIASRVASVPELVEAGVTGWLVEPGEVEPLADAMEAAATADVEEVERLGAAARERVAERHDQVAEAAKLAELIAQAVRASR